MKTLLLAFTLGIFFVGVACSQTDRYVTLTVRPGFTSTSITIAETETAHVVTYTSSQPTITYYGVTIGSAILSYGGPFPAVSPISVVRGPATISLGASGNTTAFLTLQITPESFDPNRTLILPPSTNQVAVCLETSTNLVSWITATNGIYGSPDTARFFRIKMQTQ